MQIDKVQTQCNKHTHKGNLPVKCNTSFSKNILCLIQLSGKKNSYRAQNTLKLPYFILSLFSSRTRQLFYSAVALLFVTSLCSVNIAAFKETELLILNRHIFRNPEARQLKNNCVLTTAKSGNLGFESEVAEVLGFLNISRKYVLLRHAFKLVIAVIWY